MGRGGQKGAAVSKTKMLHWTKIVDGTDLAGTVWEGAGGARVRVARSPSAWPCCSQRVR